ncbi:MAG: response regulator transcription factor [Ruminiclostridium sp.]
MSRPAISIHKSGGWTFGSPSVLMMFYRAQGELQSELAEMDECMPHYYKITNGHGQGAEKIMRAEAAFQQGRFTDAHIELESVYAQIEGNGQENMALCCDFLAWRLSRYTDVEQRCSFEERRVKLLPQIIQCDIVTQIIELGEAAKKRKAANTRPAVFDVLTQREYEIVELMAQRFSNREIAERLFLSEGSVKQYVNQIYSKLHIEGDTRTKRKRLAELALQKT